MNAKVCNRLGYIGMTILILILLPLFVPKLFDFKTFSVISGSMEPVIPTGSLVYVKAEDVDNLKENDVITFYGKQGSIVTHRILKIEKDGFVTKGDANFDVDLAKVLPSQVIGKVVFSLPFLGYCLQSVGFYIALFLLLLISLVFWMKAHHLMKKDGLV